MNSQPVIPTPVSVRWREFRMRVVPGLMCLAACIGAGIIWSQYVIPASFIGRVETLQANVISTKAGAISQLNVARFQRVKAGGQIAQVITTDPKVLSASINVIRAELEMIRAGINPAANSQRNAINYEQLRVDWLRQRVELATTRVNLQLAESEFKRMDRLFQDKLISESQYDASRAAQEALRSEVGEKSKLVDALEVNLQRMQSAGASAQDPQNRFARPFKWRSKNSSWPRQR
jgi:multidrug resistance efflux pump